MGPLLEGPASSIFMAFAVALPNSIYISEAKMPALSKPNV